MAGNDTAALVVALSAQLTKFEKDMNDAVGIADRKTKEIGDRFARVNPSAQGLTQAAQGIGSALQSISSGFLSAAGVAGLGLSALLATAIKLNGELAKIPGLARLAGVSTDRLQEIKFAGAIKGVGDEAFATSLNTSVKLLDEAQRQVNTLSRLFAANGISLKDQNGQLIKFDALLEIAAKLMLNTRSEQEKLKIAEMLGLSREWVAALRDGPEAFKKAAAEAHNAGAVIDQATVNKAKEFDKAWTEAIVRFKAGITSTLADLANAFSEFWTAVLDSVPGGSFVAEKFRQMFGGLERLTIPELEDVLQRSIEQGVNKIEIARIQSELDRKLGKEPLKVVVPVQIGDDSTVIPKDKQKNAFDSEVFTINKKIAATDAETRSVGLNNDEHERAKTIAVLEEAAKKANIDAGYQSATVTDLQRQKIIELADAVQAATRRHNESHAALAQFAVDGSNVVKQFDQATIASLNNFGTALGDIVTGSASASDAFKKLGQQVVRSVTDMVIRMTILAPIARALQSSLGAPVLGAGFFGGSPESNPNLVPLPKFASGTNSAPGGLAILGEQGPELVNLPRGSQVIPNNVLSRAGSTAPSIIYNVDASGADTAAIVRMERALNAHASMVASAFRNLDSTMVERQSQKRLLMA